jgi:hypothetical protein
MPSRRSSRNTLKPGEYRTPNGDIIQLDSEQQKGVDRGYTIIEATTTLHEPTGPNIMKTMTTDELRQQIEEDSL